ncbi:non-ribosomal peptide synthetase [Rhodococcus opacus PD630]|uniref:amino acid adenylation domain-containing protein n=1 Tax=Rhodococcus opacus TaxID=37919 RepID=UPI00029CC9E7|nr:amino acid adenylation domain-containing protein [Rhodococcus opacus]AHK33580.1 Tyrocidine synthase 3 [Rhodococcus opacus PD630]EHI40487.1 non-ribosomal peptide synthetase [Rhodococcus opacus PD630]UDG95839.1 amino acid adenylation domain-containing protein [Rhodococcus opacus PD630]
MTDVVANGGVMSGILRQCARVPGRIAIVVGDRSLTYRELDSASEELARQLAALGVRPGQVVLIHQRQSVETVVGMIAALRLGAAWCVIEPGHPVVQLRALLGDIDCGAIVFGSTDPKTPPESVRDLARSAGGRVPALHDRDADHPPVAEPADLPEDVPAGTAAYVITTSGSTGVPKAVVASRANLANMVDGRNYDYDDGDLVTFSAFRLTWDGSLLKTLWALCTGGTSVLPDARALMDAEAVAALARTWQATHLVATPSFYRLLLPHLTPLRERLRLVTLAGEALPGTLVEQHRAVLPGVPLSNEYGPTETTVSCLAHPVRDVPASIAPIGRPLGASTAYVLDAKLVEVPYGTVGDLYVGGPQISEGYASRPAVTAARFVADPFAERPGARMYHTGDLARVDPHGDIEFCGRFDGQVKVRGARVERHAVEAVLEGHPAIHQAVVLATADEHGETALTAFWVPAAAATVLPTPRDLIAHCAERLVAQAVPDRFLALGALPLAPSSKVDEVALRRLLPGGGGGVA